MQKIKALWACYGNTIVFDLIPAIISGLAVVEFLVYVAH